MAISNFNLKVGECLLVFYWLLYKVETTAEDNANRSGSEN